MKVNLISWSLLQSNQYLNNSKNSSFPDSIYIGSKEHCSFVNTVPQYFHPSFGQLGAAPEGLFNIFTRKLYNLANKAGEWTCNDDLIELIKKEVNKNNIDALLKMASINTKDGASLYEGEAVFELARAAKTVKQSKILNKFLDERKEYDTIIGAFDVLKEFKQKDKNTNGLVTKIIDRLVLAKTPEGDDRFGSLGMSDIVRYIKTDEDFERLNELLKNEKMTTFDIVQALAGRHFVSSKQKPAVEYNSRYFCNLGKELFNLGHYQKDVKRALYEAMNNDARKAEKILEVALDDSISNAGILLTNFNKHSMLSDNVLKDIKEYVIQGKPEVITIPVGTPHKKILKMVPKGDVCEMDSELYVNDDDSLVKLKMTKEKFTDLFPTVMRFNFLQGTLGDCWLIAVLGKMMDNPLARPKLYELFRQEGKDIFIMFPNALRDIKFPNSELLSANSVLDGPLGIQMIEQAYSIHRKDGYSIFPVEDISNIVDADEQLNRLCYGNPSEAVKELLPKAVFGVYDGDDLLHKDIYFRLICNNSNNNDSMLYFTLNNKHNHDEKYVSEAYKLFADHTYSISSYDSEKGLVGIMNPHNSGIVTEVPIYELIQHMDGMTLVSLKPDKKI